MKNKCPFFDPRRTVAAVYYGENPGWCTEQCAPCARDYLCPSAKTIRTMGKKLDCMRKALHVAAGGLRTGRDFIGAGLDGMTGGEDEYREIKECLSVVNAALKIKVKS